MTQQIINLGTSANAGDGDNLRSAMDKTNDNFTELYGANSVSSNLAFSGQTISSYNTNGDIILGPDGTDTIRPLGIYVGTAGIITSGPVTNATYANTTVRDSTLTQPVAGQMIFITDIAKLQFYNGSAWETVTSAV
jgi:hypothetical protein